MLDNTKHTLLVGDLATKFAVDMGFEEEELSTNFSNLKWQKWKENQVCQPNFWKVIYEIILCQNQSFYPPPRNSLAALTTSLFMCNNHLQNVIPNPKESCGPYHPSKEMSMVVGEILDHGSNFGKETNHDTIGMVAIDKDGHIAAGTSTNGASFKIPGLVQCFR